MNDIAGDRVGPMRNPPHLGELIRESMDEVGWNVTDTAARLGCERGTLSRLLNGKAGVSANMALALEDVGWGTAEHWMRMQVSYALAQARRDRAAGQRRAGEAHTWPEAATALSEGRVSPLIRAHRLRPTVSRRSHPDDGNMTVQRFVPSGV